MNIDVIKELFSLDGKVAIVTGGAGRLGMQHVKILLDAGARVASFDVLDNSDLDDSVLQIKVDITKLEEVRKAVEKVFNDLGRVDILINNATMNPKVGKDASEIDNKQFSPYEDYPQELWDKEISVGLSGSHFCSQAVAPYMIEQKSGCIINVGSTSSITAPDNRKYEKGKFKSVAYPTIKTALLGLTRAWASYFASVSPGIKVNSVSFGAVNFGSMEPEFLAKLGARNMLGRPANPEEYRGVILFLSSKASDFITASNLVVDGGQTAW